MSESIQVMSVNKITNNHTYTPVSNYWAPLANLLIDADDSANMNEEFAVSLHEERTTQDKSIIIDSGATSHFVTTTTNLPGVGGNFR
jgi:hypothetical protein